MRQFGLLVFDWDGTVADSLHHIVWAMQAAITEVDLPVRTREEILSIIGLGMHEAALELYPNVDTVTRQHMVQSYGQFYLQATTGNTVLFADARATLEKLQEQGYVLAVATGKSRRGLDRAFAETGVKEYFQASRCADETVSKPHPQMLFELMQALEMPPEQTLMIGDSHHDLQMATNAGVSSVAVNYGAQPASRLLEYHPLTTLNRLGELPLWLNNR